MFNEFCNKTKIILLAGLACTLLCANAQAQRARFDDFFASQPSSIPTPARTLQGLPGNFQNGLPNPGTIINTPGSQPPASLQMPNFAPGGGLPPVLAPQNGLSNIQVPRVQAPSFDPYRTPNQAFPIFPRANQAPVLPQVNPQYNQPQLAPQQFIPPQFNGQYGSPQFGTPRSPNQWPYQGTGTNWLPSADWTWPQEAWRSFRTQFLPRVLERPRARQTYLHGSGGNELNINDIELATTATLPNFLQGPTPLRISPGFIFHFWDGPDSIAHPNFDLPAQAYSTYLAFDHITDPSKISGFENNLTIGYYSDFDNTSSDAIRLTGKLLGWYRLNQYTVGKLGVEYLDRVNVKLLPAVGVYMTPNPDMKFDLYFQNPNSLTESRTSPTSKPGHTLAQSMEAEVGPSNDVTALPTRQTSTMSGRMLVWNGWVHVAPLDSSKWAMLSNANYYIVLMHLILWNCKTR